MLSHGAAFFLWCSVSRRLSESLSQTQLFLDCWCQYVIHFGRRFQRPLLLCKPIANCSDICGRYLFYSVLFQSQLSVNIQGDVLSWHQLLSRYIPFSKIIFLLWLALSCKWKQKEAQNKRMIVSRPTKALRTKAPSAGSRQQQPLLATRSALLVAALFLSVWQWDHLACFWREISPAQSRFLLSD